MKPRNPTNKSVADEPGEDDQELVHKLHYVSVLAQTEAKRIRRRIQPLLDTDTPPSRNAIEGVLNVLEELAVRISVVEELMERQSILGRGLDLDPILVGQLEWSCEDLHEDVLYPPETDGQGGVTRWTNAVELNLRLPVYRNVDKILRLYFSAIVKQEYATSLDVLVDGERMDHVLRNTKEGLCLECHLRPASDLGTTRYTVRLPAVHRPSELSDSDDERVLGIAVRRVSVMDTQPPMFRRLLRRWC